jgi:CRISPR-associated protein Csb2
VSSLSKRGIPKHSQGKLSSSKARGRLILKEPLSDEEAAAWIRANPRPEFAAALQEARRIFALPGPIAMPDVAGDEIPLSSLANLLATLAPSPEIWLPRTGVGHTRNFFTIHKSGVTRTTGSAVFDTFAAVDKTQPVLFAWPTLDLSSEQDVDLRLLLARLGYFGRAESWCLAELCDGIPADAIQGRTHWRCICWEDASAEARDPLGREHRDFTLERRLAPLPFDGNRGSTVTFPVEARRLLPSLVARRRPKPGEDNLQRFTVGLEHEADGFLLLRCLPRQSGEDMKDGLERPVGTRWVHYAVPREVYNLPPRPPRRTNPIREEVHVVRYVLNTATTQRPVLPQLTDALLIGERFRRALMSRHQVHSENFSGKTASGQRLEGHQHGFFLPEDEDLDGLIDHVTA